MIDYYRYDLQQQIEKINKTKYSCINFFNWYGYNKIICKLYKLKPSKFLSARVFHSVFPNEYELYLKDTIETPEVVLCNRLSQVDYLISKGRNKDNTFATGALFPLYRKLKNIEKCTDAKGTIAFPTHSSRRCDIIMGYQEYIDGLKNLPDEFKPIDVCLHWRDINNGIHKVFLDNGINVYSAGHCNDPDFCDNFYEICKHYKYATCNSVISTSLLYAAEMGVIPFYYSPEGEPVMNEHNIAAYGLTQQEYDDAIQAHYDFFGKVIPKYPDINFSDEQLTLMKDVMGLNEKSQSPKNLIKKALLKRKTQNIKTYLKGKFINLKNKLLNIQ